MPDNNVPQVDLAAVSVSYDGATWRFLRVTPGLRAFAAITQHDRRYPSDVLAERAWPGGLPAYAECNARAALSSALSDFRAALREAGRPIAGLADKIVCVDGDWFFDRHEVACCARRSGAKRRGKVCQHSEPAD